MKRSASETIKNGYFNLERLRRSFRLAWPGISTLEWLWNGFVSDAELSSYFIGGFIPYISGVVFLFFLMSSFLCVV